MNNTKSNKFFSFNSLFSSNELAFTLAEVLIALAIIGVIAAMTIPILIKTQQEKATITALKKAYSTLSSAYNLAVQENGTPDNWDIIALNSSAGSKNILDKLSPYLKTLTDCQSSSGCFYSGNYQKLMGGTWGSIEGSLTTSLGLNKIILSDGTSIYIQARSSDCTEGAGTNTSLALQNICALIGVDINGAQKPNRWGYDLFSFELTKYGIIPRGSTADTASSFAANCDSSSSIGWGCAAWVIYNENMEYIKCNGLSWAGQHQCN